MCATGFPIDGAATRNGKERDCSGGGGMGKLNFCRCSGSQGVGGEKNKGKSYNGKTRENLQWKKAKWKTYNGKKLNGKTYNGKTRENLEGKNLGKSKSMEALKRS